MLELILTTIFHLCVEAAGVQLKLWYYANVYGLEDVSLYSDGWIGWSNNPSHPVETGEPKE